MVRTENGKTIIEIDNFEDFEHDFIQDLQFDLIQLMNCVHALKKGQDLDLPLPSSFLSIMQLQKALVPTIDQLKVIYPKPLFK
ncbi:hypothetical protein [Pedobacter gandavensis]|uniref:hypothetical protein n=1 Tax=Pedobacter gandavensis TaxID=2679963 RepID=UPI00292CE663|nr:hypothetical protein [Pedobacter gandavensis]